MDTDVWLGDAEPSVIPPPFVHRNDRKVRLVAFLNLKGGVGKTTLVANLGTAFATGLTGQKLRVLLIDLDYQGTLSNMCVSRTILLDRRNKHDKRTAQVLLSDACLTTPADQVLSRLLALVESLEAGGSEVEFARRNRQGVFVWHGPTARVSLRRAA